MKYPKKLYTTSGSVIRFTPSEIQKRMCSHTYAMVLEAQMETAKQLKVQFARRVSFGAKIAMERNAVAAVVKRAKMRAIHALSEFTLAT